MNKYYYTLCIKQRVDEYEDKLLLWNDHGIIVCNPDQLAQKAEFIWECQLDCERFAARFPKSAF